MIDSLDELLRSADRPAPPEPTPELERRILLAFQQRQRPLRRSRRQLGIPALLAASLLLWAGWSIFSPTVAVAPDKQGVWQSAALRERLEVIERRAAFARLSLLERRRATLTTWSETALAEAPPPRAEPAATAAVPVSCQAYLAGLEVGSLSRDEQIGIVRLALLKQIEPGVLGRDYLHSRYRELVNQYGGTVTGRLASAELSRLGRGG